MIRKAMKTNQYNDGCISQINEYISSKLKTIKRLTHDNAVIQLILDDLYENSINQLLPAKAREYAVSP